MTDYELVSHFQEVVGNLHAVIGNYLSVLFAFLVTSYLVAASLTRAMAVVMLMLFSALALELMIEMLLLNQDVSGLAVIIRERVAAGSVDLAWHGAVRGVEDALTAVQMAAMVGGYVAALAFFVHQRRVGTRPDQAE